MMKLKKIFILFLMKLLPSTRLFRLKSFLLNLAGFNIDANARIVSSVKFLGVENISVGSDTFIGHETLLTGSSKSKIKIGSNCDISSRVSIVTGTHEIDLDGLHIAGKGTSKNIVIEDGVWIGINVTVLPGVTIGEKSIIAAGSVVINDVPSNVMVAGNPAKIKKELKERN